MKNTLKFMKVSSVALLLASAAAFAVVTMSWDAAQAKNNNGNGGKRPVTAGGGGHGGGGATRTERRGGGKPDRTRIQATEGETTEETVERVRRAPSTLETETRQRVRNRNGEEWEHPASHASATGFANASPNSRLGRITAARAAAAAEASVAEDEPVTAEGELFRLTGLTDDEIATEFPSGGYEDALSDAIGNTAVDTIVDTITGAPDTPEDEDGEIPTYIQRANSH